MVRHNCRLDTNRTIAGMCENRTHQTGLAGLIGFEDRDAHQGRIHSQKILSFAQINDAVVDTELRF